MLVCWYRILDLLPGIGKVKADLIFKTISDNQGRIDFNGLSGNKWSSKLDTYQGLLQ